MAVGSAADGRKRQQIAILDVHQAGGHFSPLESPADTQKIPSLIVGKCGVANTMKTVAAENDPATETVRSCGSFLLGIEATESQVEAVQVLPHFARDAVADGASIFTGFGDALHDGTWVLGVEGQKLEDIVGSWFCVELAEESFFAGHRENRLPAHAMRLRGLLEQRVKRDIENSRSILGASDVPCQPEKGIGDTREHVSTLPAESRCLCSRRLGKN